MKMNFCGIKVRKFYIVIIFIGYIFIIVLNFNWTINLFKSRVPLISLSLGTEGNSSWFEADEIWFKANQSLIDGNQIRLDGDQNLETANQDWIKARELLLSRQNVSKVIVFAYGRGGSTFCSDLFNIDIESTILWYEPLHGFYSHQLGLPYYHDEFALLYHRNFTRKPFAERSVNELTDFLSDLLTCNVDRIPSELLSTNVFIAKSRVFNDFNRCMKKQRAFVIYSHCTKYIRRYCFHEEHLGMEDVSGDDGRDASGMRCTEVLQSVRRLRIPAIASGNSKEANRKYSSKSDERRFLQLFMKGNHNETRLKKTLYDFCYRSVSISQPSRNDNGSRMVESLKGIDENKASCSRLRNKLYSFQKQHVCMERLSRRTLGCRRMIRDICDRTGLITAEIQSAFLADLEALVRRIPDVRIVHYVRDPRAVVVSRTRAGWPTFRDFKNWTIANESKALCMKMRYDLKASRRLQRIYPESVITVRYEDLVRYPLNTVTEMYDYFGRPIPAGLDQWVNRTMNAVKDNGLYGVQRSNSTEHLSSWRSKVTDEDLLVMKLHCEDVIRKLNYDF